MNAWDGTLDFGVVHPLVFLECRLGEGPVLETLDTIIADGAFGAVEIAPVKQPGVRRAAKALLGEAGLQVVYLPILPNILGEVNLGHADPEDVARRRWNKCAGCSTKRSRSTPAWR